MNSAREGLGNALVENALMEMLGNALVEMH